MSTPPDAGTPGVDPRTARRRYATACALFWLPVGLTIAPLLLLFTERGATLPTVAALFAVHSLTTVALELPTGGLSDVIGRRGVLTAAGVLNAAAFTLLALGAHTWVLATGMALMGAGRALSSGPAEAWYVDAVQARQGPGAELRTGLARGSAAGSAALAVGTLLGGLLPWLLAGPAAAFSPVLPLSVPPLLGALAALLYAGYALLALREAPRAAVSPSAVLRGVPAIVVDGLRLGVCGSLVRRVLLTSAAIGGALAAVELLTPGRVAVLTGTVESGAALFAGLACAGYACSALGNQLAPRVARLTGGSARAVRAALAVGGGGLLLLGATAGSSGPPGWALGAVGYGLLYLGLGAAGPNQNDLLHRVVPSSRRATALSVQSLALQLAGALVGLVVAPLAWAPLPWWVAAAPLLVVALLWRSGAATRTGYDIRPRVRTPSP
ncbi:MFS transporter [Streptomyces sp. NPDC049906]|uniref:MFS transporter n=1 Tax=Streptomyces sp. NPDC049906 TaxID=3155656 RepID=UPI0034472FF2